MYTVLSQRYSVSTAPVNNIIYEYTEYSTTDPSLRLGVRAQLTLQP